MVSARGMNRGKGETSWLSATNSNPAARAISPAAISCAGLMSECRKAIAAEVKPSATAAFSAARRAS
ncbi:hypothetical protein LRS10_11685 [Phenylobacterium sp. J426]|uniref:hypothetical protein n=1 Tax=Phenylobacterium sp. J426 TaxID=2898439 RepID=UPI002150B0D0|nr:hypothetical protein [Phenylobacterium sp. J426]MCR5874770.1 hypothetical protein [Phenylobacterium sp. J426]